MEYTITAKNFEAEVLESSLPVLLDFWAVWCGPCRMLAPIIAEIAEEYDGKIKVGKVDVDNEQELAVQYGINAIPALMVFKDGKLVNTGVGYMDKESVLKLVK